MNPLIRQAALLVCVLVFSVATDNAVAANATAVARQAEASMVVTGSLVIEPDGRVRSYAIDHADKLPAPVNDLIGKNVPHWRFEPVLLNSRPVAAKAEMSVRVIANPTGDGHYALAIKGAHFGEKHPGMGIRREQMVQPGYPVAAVQHRVSGTVYLVLKLDPQGRVTDVAAEQVNLGVADDDRSMGRWRDMLARSSIRAARAWTFTLDPANQKKARDQLLVRVPVAYALHAWNSRPRRPSDAYGTWKVYIPGPRQLVPWIDQRTLVSESADALPGDGVYPVGNELHLTTPPGGA